MDFEFWPWERLSEDVTDGEARARVEVDGGEWLFRQCGRLVFARERRHQGSEWNFLVSAFFYAPLDERDQLVWEELNVSSDDLSRWVCQGNRANTLERVFKVNGLILARHRENGGWALLETLKELKDDEGGTPFHLNCSSPIRKAPSSSLYGLLQSEWQNECSELRLAAHFAALTELERRLHGIQTRLGTPQEFVAILRYALNAFGSKWPAAPETVRLGFSANGPQLRFTLGENHPFGTRESAILNHIVRAFEPRQKPDSPDLPLCVRQFTEGGWSRSFSVEVARPSMHERLEGMLELRNWLEQHWPDGVKHLGKVI